MQPLIFHSNEFKKVVQEVLCVFDREITTEDALLVEELDLSEFYFKKEDFETLFLFANLNALSIHLDSRICIKGFRDLFWTYCGEDIDFCVFRNMNKLKSLCVFGGEDYDIPFINLDKLIPLEKLEHLELHNFGPVDLFPLCKMPQLKVLELHKNRHAQNISSLCEIMWLKELILENIFVENLEFLDYLPDDLYLKMNHIEILTSSNLDVRKWRRFKKRNIYEIIARDKGGEGFGENIDLSPLNE